MTRDTLQQEIEEAIPKLLNMARDLSWNNISDNCFFILSEIKDSSENFHKQSRKQINENRKKTALPLQELMPALHSLYENLYEIDLLIYKVRNRLTVIDIQYYPKSSLDQDYRQTIADDPPMFHCKVLIPPWLSEQKEKFDINWAHKPLLIRWKKLLMRWNRKKYMK